MDRVIAARSPDDRVAALQLLSVLEECCQLSPAEARTWKRRITRLAEFNAFGAETGLSA